jgi:hypothetical protein
VQTLLLELTLVAQYRRPAAALRALINDLLGIEAANRRIAGAVSGLDTRYGASHEPLVGARMPDIALTSYAGVAESLRGGSFVLLSLTGSGPAESDVAGWAGRVAVATASGDAHPALTGVTEVLIRPDGHVAWLSRDGRPAAERFHALTAWAGKATTTATTRS